MTNSGAPLVHSTHERWGHRCQFLAQNDYVRIRKNGLASRSRPFLYGLTKSINTFDGYLLDTSVVRIVEVSVSMETTRWIVCEGKHPQRQDADLQLEELRRLLISEDGRSLVSSSMMACPEPKKTNRIRCPHGCGIHGQTGLGCSVEPGPFGSKPPTPLKTSQCSSGLPRRVRPARFRIDTTSASGRLMLHLIEYSVNRATS